jgi:hypothetical protein
MSAFINCNIWSVHNLYVDDFGYTLVRRIYPYNSDTSEFNAPIPPGFIQIPEFEIKNLHLLDNLDYDLINKFSIPIIKRDEEGNWSIDLKCYEAAYLQHTNSTQSNRE